MFEVSQFIITLLRYCFVFINGGSSCLVCGKKTNLQPLCNDCIKKFYKVSVTENDKRCSCCGKKLISEKELCTDCRTKKIFEATNDVFPLYEYELWNKELLFKWKIEGVRTLSFFFAEQINRFLKKFNDVVIVPVPPRKGKIRKKGWDQIEELCLFLEKRYGYKILRILERNSKDEQKKLDREGRLETIGKSYSVVENDILVRKLKAVGGKMPEHVFLLDDILTTGATAESCAEVLKKGGVKRVDVIALFVAV